MRFAILICCLSAVGCGGAARVKELASQIEVVKAELAASEAKVKELEAWKAAAMPTLEKAPAMLQQAADVLRANEKPHLGSLKDLVAKFTSGDEFMAFGGATIDGRTTLIKCQSLSLSVALTSYDGIHVHAAQMMMAGSNDTEDNEFKKIGYLARFPTHFDDRITGDEVLDLMSPVKDAKTLGVMKMRFSPSLQVEAYQIEKPELMAVRVRPRPDKVEPSNRQTPAH
jgi:outer membrane murein-binding lipoprotein Lpp